jgi:hypothetical protein
MEHRSLEQLTCPSYTGPVFEQKVSLDAPVFVHGSDEVSGDVSEQGGPLWKAQQNFDSRYGTRFGGRSGDQGLPGDEGALIVKEAIYEKSGWGWIDKYKADFLLEAPVLVVVVGDPEKTGAHKFHEGTETVYQHAGAAAIQNMLLAAQALGLGSLWFTLFDRAVVAEILGIGSSGVPLALICLGKPAGDLLQTPRKEAASKTAWIR